MPAIHFHQVNYDSMAVRITTKRIVNVIKQNWGLTFKLYSSKKIINRLLFCFGSGIFNLGSGKEICFGGFALWKILRLSMTD
jgi:hypothetical protein